MKKVFWMLALTLCVQTSLMAQTKTTQTLDNRHEGLSLYFYKNTLRMLNQTDNKEFDEMVKDIEKMKFLLIDMESDKFSSADYKKLKGDYKKESYDEIMTSRFDGRNFDVYVKEEKGRVQGTVVLATDSTQLFVLDIIGRIALDKVGTLFKTLDDNSDIGKKIKDFVHHVD